MRGRVGLVTLALTRIIRIGESFLLIVLTPALKNFQLSIVYTSPLAFRRVPAFSLQLLLSFNKLKILTPSF